MRFHIFFNDQSDITWWYLFLMFIPIMTIIALQESLSGAPFFTPSYVSPSSRSLDPPPNYIVTLQLRKCPRRRPDVLSKKSAFPASRRIFFPFVKVPKEKLKITTSFGGHSSSGKWAGGPTQWKGVSRNRIPMVKITFILIIAKSFLRVPGDKGCLPSSFLPRRNSLRLLSSLSQHSIDFGPHIHCSFEINQQVSDSPGARYRIAGLPFGCRRNIKANAGEPLLADGNGERFRCWGKLIFISFWNTTELINLCGQFTTKILEDVELW